MKFRMIRAGAVTAALLLLLVASVIAGQELDLAGTWAGPIVTRLGPGGVEITFAREGGGWKAAMKMRAGGQELAPTVAELNVAGAQISFSATIDQTIIKFQGTVTGNKLDGTVEAFQSGNKFSDGTFNIVRGGQMPPLQQAQGAQVADPDFDAKVTEPAYRKNGPKVLFDEAHNNFHTATGRYKPFADLITSDGYVITPNKEKFSLETLKGYQILVISNALGHARMGAAEATRPAFTEEESDAVRDWVKAGGSLLLIADHAPMGSANQILGDRFGVHMSKGYTSDPNNYDVASNNRGFIIYTRESSRLADHAITRGRKSSEKLNKVIAFTGQSLKGPADSVAFMKLADTARDSMPGTNNQPSTSAAGRAQGIAMKFGKGRIVFLGEAAMLSAQMITGPNGFKFGMNRTDIDNRQLALNIMHWLSHLLK